MGLAWIKYPKKDFVVTFSYYPPELNAWKARCNHLPCQGQEPEQMATPLISISGGSQVDRWPASTVPTVTYRMSLPLLKHPWETRWGD